MSTSKIYDEVELAWEIHKDADSLLQQRINSFLLSQSFFVGVFVLLLTSDKMHWWTMVLASGLAVCALAILAVMQRELSKTEKRLWFLKEEYLIRCDVYQNYITANKDRENLSYGSRKEKFACKRPLDHPYTDHLPYVVGLFWTLALLLLAIFFMVPGSQNL